MHASGSSLWNRGVEEEIPFFRFPGFADTRPLLDDLAVRRIAVFGADLWASDWIPMTPEVELERLMARLDKAGRGIILLHDTKKQTADMLPKFLEALRSGGYHVVHVIPGSGPTPLRTAPAGWTSETEAILTHMWPKLPRGESLPLSGPDDPPARAASPDHDGATPLTSAGVPAPNPALRDAEP